MSHLQTRKNFVAKLLGIAATIGIAPKLLAKAVPSAVAPVPAASPVMVKPEVRAIARTDAS